MEETIREAILGRKVVEIRYGRTTRVVEPYLYYETRAGERVLHGRQISGDYENTPPPDWCNLRAERMISVTLTGETYDHPHEDYNPQSRQFYRILIQVPL